jgi:hypothetical protein
LIVFPVFAHCIGKFCSSKGFKDGGDVVVVAARVAISVEASVAVIRPEFISYVYLRSSIL